MTALPNFLYLGPDKAGSSWLHEVLLVHPEIHLTPAKDLYFFDRYFDRGVDWYAGKFDPVTGQHVVGEICQDYLADPRAPQRIRDVLGPDVRMMVTLRDPVDRAFSSWLYMLKHGETPGPFREALTNRPELVTHSSYGAALQRYLELFDRDRLHIAMFDDLTADPQRFIDDVLRFLGVAPMTLSAQLQEARLPASKARSVTMARLVRRGADLVRLADGADLVGRVKRSPLTHRLLYQPFGDDKPVLDAADRAHLRTLLAPDVALLEELSGLDVRTRWGWDVDTADSVHAGRPDGRQWRPTRLASDPASEALRPAVGG